MCYMAQSSKLLLTQTRLESFAGVAITAAQIPLPPSPPAPVLPPPSSSSSQFRLSLSLEGKAEIVSSLQSPPRPVQPTLPLDVTTLPPVRAPRTLQRSRSALPGITLPPISALTANLPPQLPRGRSRDVSAWESCCDSDTRDALTKLAENESSGSAVAAISLLRSSSQTSSLSNLVHGHTPSNSNVLRPNSSKRNAAPSNRRESNHKKAKLARSSSSVARLQSLPPSASFDKPERAVVEFEPEKKKGGLSITVLPSGGDSDKENWSPDEDGNPNSRRRPLPSIAAAATALTAAKGTNARRAGPRVLGESRHNGNVSKRTLLSGRANTAPVPRLRGGKGVASSMLIFEDGGNEDENDENAGGLAKKPKRSDDEVERFMRGEVSPSKKGDVDCVAGLLALSQGNWR